MKEVRRDTRYGGAWKGSDISGDLREPVIKVGDENDFGCWLLVSDGSIGNLYVPAGL